jgi:cytoskeleton-associated protein 5
MRNCICYHYVRHLIVGIVIFLPAGTLDALRERMKSIQAAAVGHFDGSQARPLASMNGSNMPHAGTRLDGEPQQQSNIPPMDERALSGLQARMERLKSGSMEPL